MNRSCDQKAQSTSV